ncbi:MAG: thioredoxin family protein [Mycoplasmatales bacterium]|nr:thioredoxin family protein [Mycoplasmatales bacterium]
MKNEPALWVQENAENIELIDVRTPAEFAMSHVKGAINIQKDELIANHAKYLKKDKEYYIMCGSGGRSQFTITSLFLQGYNLTNVAEGISGMDPSKLIMEFKPKTKQDGRLILNHLKNTKMNFIIIFAENCGTCDMLKPILESLDKRYKDVSTTALKITDYQEIAKQENVIGTPTTYAFIGDKEVFHFKGYLPEIEILKKIQEHNK